MLDLKQKTFVLGALDLWVLLPEIWLNKFHRKQVVSKEWSWRRVVSSGGFWY